MAKAPRRGQMELSTKASTKKAKRTAKASSSGLIIQPTMASLLITILMALAYMFGLISENITASGKTTRCTAKEFSHGQMDESTQVLITMIESMVLAHSSGQMVADMKANG